MGHRQHETCCHHHISATTPLTAAAIAGALVVQCSALNRPPQVWASWPLDANGADSWRLISDAQDVGEIAPLAAAFASEVASTTATLTAPRVLRIQLPDADGAAEALVALPTAEPSDGPFPWVMRPHGGPHSSALDSFSLQDALLLASGVALILPNYRGSLGYGDAFIDALLGHAGRMDVDDCGALVRLALAQYPALLDPARGACYGGSHGGFLTAHLLGSAKHKELFSCGALWNPVVDLPSMLGVTDIPEWCAAEAYATNELKWPLSIEQLGTRTHAAAERHQSSTSP